MVTFVVNFNKVCVAKEDARMWEEGRNSNSAEIYFGSLSVNQNWVIKNLKASK